MVNSRTLIGLVGLALLPTSLFAQNYDNLFRPYHGGNDGEFREYRSVKSIDFTEDNVYALNARVRYSNGVISENSGQFSIIKKPKNSLANDNWESVPIPYGNNEILPNAEAVARSRTLVSAEVNGKDVMFMGNSDSEVRKYIKGVSINVPPPIAKNDWIRGDESETGIQSQTFKANATAKYFEPAQATWFALLGLSDVPNGDPTLYRTSMTDNALVQWNPLTMSDNPLQNFILPVIDIIVSERVNPNSGEPIIYVAVNDGNGSSTNGVYWSTDGGANFEQIDYFTDSQKYITALGYMNPNGNDSNASGWQDYEMIFGIYNIPKTTVYTDPTYPYITKDDYFSSGPVGCGVLAQRMEVSSSTLGKDGNMQVYELNYSGQIYQNQVPPITAAKGANFLTDLEPVYGFSVEDGSGNSLGNGVSLFVSDYGNGLYQITQTYSGFLSSTPGNVDWILDLKSNHQEKGKKYVSDIRKNPDQGLFTLKMDKDLHYNQSPPPSEPKLYAGGYCSFGRIDDPDGTTTGQGWEMQRGIYNVKEHVYAGVIFTSHFTSGTVAQERGILITDRAVFINSVHPFDPKTDTPIWQIYYSPGGRITTASVDRFGNLTFDPDLGPDPRPTGEEEYGTTGFISDAIALGTRYEELSLEPHIFISAADSGRSYIHVLEEHYTINNGIAPQSDIHETTVQKTNYTNKMRKVNDIKVIADIPSLVVAGIDKCPNGVTCAEEELRFIIAGIPDDLQGVSHYDGSSNYTGALIPSSTNSNIGIKKVGVWTDSRNDTQNSEPFYSGYASFYGVSTDNILWEIFHRAYPGGNGKYLVTKKHATELGIPAPNKMNDVIALNTNFVTQPNFEMSVIPPATVPPPANYTDLYFSIAVSAESGIYVSERGNYDTYHTSSTSPNSVLETNFTNTTAHLNYDDYQDFAERPMWSVNEKEAFCIVRDNSITNGARYVLYSNNLVEGNDEVGCGIFGNPTNTNRQDIDWIEIKNGNTESNYDRWPKTLWYSNDKERSVLVMDLGGAIDVVCQEDLVSVFTGFGDYDKHLYSSNHIVTGTGGHWAYVTKDIFKLEEDLDFNSGTNTINGVWWLDGSINLEPSTSLTVSDARIYFFAGNQSGSPSLPNLGINVDEATLTVSSSVLSSTRQNNWNTRTNDNVPSNAWNWKGILIESDEEPSNVFVSNSTVENCTKGIATIGTLTPTGLQIDVNSSEFSNTAEECISLTTSLAAPIISIADSDFDNYSFSKEQVLIQNANATINETIEFKGNRFYGSTTYPIRITNSSNISLGTEGSTGLPNQNFCTYTAAGAYFENSSNILCDDGFENLGDADSGLKFVNCTNVTVENNSIKDCSLSCIDVSENTDEIDINHNQLGQGTQQIVPVNGIYIENSDFDISDNYIYNSGYGIQILGSLSGTSKVANDTIVSSLGENYAGIYFNETNKSGVSGVVEVENNWIAGFVNGIKAENNSTSSIKIGKDDTPSLGNLIVDSQNSFYFDLNSSAFGTLIRDNTSVSQTKTTIYCARNNSSVVDAGKSEDYGNNSFDPISSQTTPLIVSSVTRVENHSAVTVLAQGNYWGIPETEYDSDNCEFENYFVGSVDYCEPLFVKPTGLPKIALGKQEDENLLPKEYFLQQNYPNPFNPNTTIKFGIPDKGNAFVTLKIFNVLGQEVKTLVNEIKTPGIYDIVWNGTDRFNRKVSSGVYFYRIQSNEFVSNKKLLLLK